MKKTLSLLAVLGMVSIIGTQTAQAFSWSSLNPAYWGQKCNRCEKKKADCGCKKKCDPCERISQPCPTGAAAPCDPCKKSTPCNPCQKQVQQPCNPCDQLQQMNK